MDVLLSFVSLKISSNSFCGFIRTLTAVSCSRELLLFDFLILALLALLSFSRKIQVYANQRKVRMRAPALLQLCTIADYYSQLAFAFDLLLLLLLLFLSWFPWVFIIIRCETRACSQRTTVLSQGATLRTAHLQ